MLAPDGRLGSWGLSAMMTASDMVLTAAGFLGVGVAGLRVDRATPEAVPETAFETEVPASTDLLSPGEPYFEAVASALRKTGYLHS